MALSDWGRFQLICDLEYLESVSDSLGVEISAEWKSLLKLLECSMDDLPKIVADSPKRIADQDRVVNFLDLMSFERKQSENRLYRYSEKY